MVTQVFLCVNTENLILYQARKNLILIAHDDDLKGFLISYHAIQLTCSEYILMQTHNTLE